VIEVVALRQSWAQPGEPICWVIDAQGKYLFEVSGRDESGNPKKGFAARVAGGVGGALLEIADGALGGSDPAYRDAPAGLVAGGQPDCAAASLVDVYRQHGGRAVWVLSDRRLALVGVSDPEEEPAGETESLFNRARRMGSGLFSGGSGEDSPAEPAEVVDDGPTPPVVRGLGEWPRSIVAACDVTTRKLGREFKAGQTYFLKIQFTDGSGLEIAPSVAEDDGRRLVAMSYGRA
jgi:hypothetical protein